MTPSSSSTSASASRPRRRPRPSREQLLRHLEILGELPDLLPSTLPPSPPASRSASPERPTGTKRRADHRRPAEAKRPRIADARPPAPSTEPPPPAAQHPGPDAHPPPPPAAAPPPTPADAPTLAFMPVRRPRRGQRPSPAEFEELNHRYLQKGRLLKYSGESRYVSSHPPSHKEHRPLAAPPPPGTPYHRHASEIARLELLDAVLYFTYALWCTDLRRGDCVRTSWSTVFQFIDWTANKWRTTDGEVEKAFLGLFNMIQSFIWARIYWYITKSHIKYDSEALYTQTCAEIAKVVQTAQRLDGGAQHTPPMLPSPASIATTSSANSTPSGAAPSPSASAAGATPPPPPGGYARFLPPELSSQFRNAPAAADKVTVPFGPAQAQQLKNQVEAIGKATEYAEKAHAMLTLPVLAKHFPATFARVAQSTYSWAEEWEPDFEDTDGELYWPTQLHNGTGIGWLCLLGKSMVHEYGKQYGYQGLAGAVPKPTTGPTGASTPADATRR